MKRNFRIIMIFALVLTLCTVVFVGCDDGQQSGETESTTQERAVSDTEEKKEPTLIKNKEVWVQNSPDLQYQGTVTGTGLYAEGDLVSLTATPRKGFSFLGWYLGDTLICESSEYTFTVGKEHITVIAKWQAPPELDPFIYELEEKIISVRGIKDPTAKEVVIPSYVTNIGPYAFADNTNLERVMLSDDVGEIDAHAFMNCTSLTEISFSNRLGRIGYQAFYGCSSLTSVSIPRYVSIIEDQAFSRCDNLGSITVDSNNNQYVSKGNCLIEKDSKKLLFGCNNSIIPSDGSVTKIAPSAFFGCKQLTNITIPDCITSIGAGAFILCTELEKISIPNSVTEIGDNAFEACEKLKEITFPDKVMTIGMNAFRGTAYYNDENNWENGVLYLQNHLLATKQTIAADCIVKDGTKGIAAYAFNSCLNLTNVTIPKSVTEMGTNVFFSSTKLTDIYYAGTEAEWNEIHKPLSLIPETVTIHYNYVSVTP